jgi:hypothetical protein
MGELFLQILVTVLEKKHNYIRLDVLTLLNVKTADAVQSVRC